MTRLSLSARLARVTALRSVIDASGGGNMLFCAGTMPAAPEDTLTAIVLATMPLATPACGTVSESPATVATLSLTPASVLAASAGVVDFVRITDGAGGGVMDLPAGLADSGMPVILSALQVYSGGEVQLLSCLIQE